MKKLFLYGAFALLFAASGCGSVAVSDGSDTSSDLSFESSSERVIETTAEVDASDVAEYRYSYSSDYTAKEENSAVIEDYYNGQKTITVYLACPTSVITPEVKSLTKLSDSEKIFVNIDCVYPFGDGSAAVAMYWRIIFRADSEFTKDAVSCEVKTTDIHLSETDAETIKVNNGEVEYLSSGCPYDDEGDGAVIEGTGEQRTIAILIACGSTSITPEVKSLTRRENKIFIDVHCSYPDGGVEVDTAMLYWKIIVNTASEFVKDVASFVIYRRS